MPPISMTIEEFAQLLAQHGEDSEPSVPPSAESLLLSRAAAIAVTNSDVSSILGVLRTADDLGLSITLEPRCQFFLMRSMNLTN